MVTVDFGCKIFITDTELSAVIPDISSNICYLVSSDFSFKLFRPVRDVLLPQKTS